MYFFFKNTVLCILYVDYGLLSKINMDGRVDGWMDG